MRRMIRYSVAVVSLIGLGSTLIGLSYFHRIYSKELDIAPVKIDRRLGEYCTEPPTTNDFDLFWSEFQAAVKSDDKEQLFPMIRTCDFTWHNGFLPLRSAYSFIDTNDPFVPAWGGLVFESRTDLDTNYARIFSKSIKQKIATGKPREIYGGRYELRWKDDRYSHYCLLFEWFKDLGYKFVGLEWDYDT